MALAASFSSPLDTVIAVVEDDQAALLKQVTETNKLLEKVINDLTSEKEKETIALIIHKLNPILKSYKKIESILTDAYENENGTNGNETKNENGNENGNDTVNDELESLNGGYLDEEPIPLAVSDDVNIENIVGLLHRASIQSIQSIHSIHSIHSRHSIGTGDLNLSLINEESKCDHFDASYIVNKNEYKDSKQIRTFVSKFQNIKYELVTQTTTVKLQDTNTKNVKMTVDMNTEIESQKNESKESKENKENNENDSNDNNNDNKSNPARKRVASHKYVIMIEQTSIDVEINVTSNGDFDRYNTDWAMDYNEKKMENYSLSMINDNMIENVFNKDINVNNTKNDKTKPKLALLRHHSIGLPTSHDNDDDNDNGNENGNNDASNDNNHKANKGITTFVKANSEAFGFSASNEEKIRWFNFYDGNNGVYGIAYVEKGFEAQLHRHFEAETYYVLYGKGKLYVNGKIRIIDNYDGKITIGSNVIHAMTPQTNFVLLLFVFNCQKPFGQIKYHWIDNFLIQ